MSLKIQKHLCELGFQCLPEIEFENVFLSVMVEIGGEGVKLMLLSEEPFTSMPRFALLEPERYGKLAHVMLLKGKDIALGSICVNDRDSISVNFARPELAVAESLKRHIALLENAITNDEWNKKELLREFYSNWLQVCAYEEKELLVSCADTTLNRFDVYSPIVDVKYGIGSHYLVEPTDNTLSSISELRHSAKNTKRNLAGKAIVVPIEDLKPAPNKLESLEKWYAQTIQELPENTKITLQQYFGQWRAKYYWVIFTSVTVSDDRTWFAVKLTSNAKKPLPITQENLTNWNIKALAVRMFSHENVVSRGGGNPSLKTKRIALVGAGSVGCEIAHKLSAAGVSDLTVFDSDAYSMDNLYRHILPQSFVGCPKPFALTLMLHGQFPWSKATFSEKELLSIQEINSLSKYDLIIIAIGRPTHELLFKQYLIDHEIEVPVINCWLEGFGVGGHAVLDIPDSKGCLLCSYVCQESGRRGLSSNLNFIEQNQSITKNIAGCGEQFISYGAVCSAQTAIMATDLAIKFLEDRATDSCKVSWKGDDFDANEEGISLTHRYYKFEKSLNQLPLLDEDCDVCNS